MKQIALMIVILPFVAACSTTAIHENRTVNFNYKSVRVVYFAMDAVLKVDSVTWDFFPSQGVLEHETDEEMQFVKVSLTFDNNSPDSFPLNYSSFKLAVADKHYQQTAYINSGQVDDILKSQEIMPRNNVSGAVYFEVPAEVEQSEVKLIYTGFDNGEKEYELGLE
ncbi:MAG: DUF4352 domain-containing protein [Candidatus Dojkabacteria bacterium]